MFAVSYVHALPVAVSMETCSNLSQVIWAGANGRLLEPQYGYRFAASATLHHADGEGWVNLRIPPNVRRWVKLNHYCEVDGMFHVVPRHCDEVGVVLGAANTVEGAIEHLRRNFEALNNEPLSIEFENFADLLKEANEAQRQGVRFTSGPIPGPEIVLQ
jgi:hypothetical protein